MQKVRINAGGQQDRKELTNRIGGLVGVAPVYAGAGGNVIGGERFRFSYVVMNITIAQDCTIVWDGRTDAETMDKVFDGLEQAGYSFERPAIETFSTATDTADNEADETQITDTDEAPAFEELRLTEHEEFGLGQQHRDHPGEDGIMPSDVPDNYEDYPHSLTIEMPLDGFTPEKFENLSRLVTAKAPLLKAALGVDNLPIEQTADALSFPWFKSDAAIDAAHMEAYSTLVSMLCKTAIEKKRVTAKEKDAPDNPKYAMRCFLLSLGFIGEEYKAARKILLSNLDGNSSWKNGKKTETEVSGDE